MHKINKLSKLFMYISLLCGVLWLGSYLTRLLLTYQLFEPKDYVLKPYVTPENLGGILRTLGAAASTTSILYSIFILALIIFLISSKINLKKNGWLFITVLIVLITLPFEIYLMTIDYSIIKSIYYSSFDSRTILNLFIKRLKILGSFSLVEIFSYFAAVYFILFQPLTKRDEIKNED